MSDQNQNDQKKREVKIQVNGLSKSFSEGSLNVDVLDNIDLTIHAGEMVGIIGSSGSGKSTLLHQIGGLDVPSAGSVEVCGQQLSSLSDAARGLLRNRSLGFIYQFHHLLPEFTALENVAMPLVIGGASVNVGLEKAGVLLDRVGLKDRVEHKPGELSGGERQRTAIARALANQPEVVLADEPTGNLDYKTAEQIYALMLELNKELDTAFVIVTHDQSLARRMGKVYELVDGRIAESLG